VSITYKYDLQKKNDLFKLYEILGWNSFLKLSSDNILKAMKQSFLVVYAYDGDKLIGTGRVVSDGIINAYLCGLGVLPNYQNRGIGTEIIKKITKHCKENNLHLQFLCEKNLLPYYKKMGFEEFAIGMKLL